MPDKKLTVLVAVIIVLNLGHDFDHIVRGDFRWQLTAKYIPAYAIIVAKYAILGFGLYFYLKNKVGPLFWAIVAGISVALGWLAHFSPFTVQTPQFIYAMRRAPFDTPNDVADRDMRWYLDEHVDMLFGQNARAPVPCRPAE